jgi:DNA-binding winged helix-turn-helix (wHTH) protein
VTYRFGECEVDSSAYEVRRGGYRIPLARQPMELLLLLLERRPELVSREDVAQRLWAPGVFTDLDAGTRTAILRIRQALGDSRESRIVETVPGKGYRFVAPVEVVTGPEPPPDTRRHNLPIELTSFVGRRTDLLELPGILASSRLLSLTGAGGVGKTRLALRLAAAVVHAYRDGVWLVDLAPLSAPDLVAQTIATALDLREGPQRSAREALLEYLRRRQFLLVLDNCEHLVAACADLVETLLRDAPSVRVLATSREALGVSGEIICRVPSLSVPDALAPVPVASLVESEATQ